MSEIAFPMKQDASVHVFRDNICENAVFELLGHYLKFCAGIGIAAPIRLNAAIIGCKGVYFCTHWGAMDLSTHAIDRSPAFLPPVEITDLGADVIPALRTWCDTLAQAAGLERSLSFDGEGTWQERRRSAW